MDRPQFRSVLASALARAGGLELATPRMTAGIDGRRTGRRSGNALEFSEYREYQAGDDLRRLGLGRFRPQRTADGQALQRRSRSAL